MMKLYLLPIIFFLHHGAYAQQNICSIEDIRTETTDWREPSSENSWNWTASDNEYEYDMFMQDPNVPNGSVAIRRTAPFYPPNFTYDPVTGQSNFSTGSNGNNGNFINSFIQGGLEQIDYHPEDGWELLHKDFGNPTGGNASDAVFFALYNRYAGIVRPFFFTRNSDGIEADDLIVEMHFDPSSTNKTALFSHYNPVMQSVKYFDPGNNLRMSNGFFTDPNGFWVYADFPVAYDPCTCMAEGETRLQFRLSYLKNAELNLTGTASGNAEQVLPQTPTSKRVGFSDHLGAISSVFSKFNKGYKATKGWKESYTTLDERASRNAATEVSAGYEAARSTATQGGQSGNNGWKVVGALIEGGIAITSNLTAIGSLVNYITGNWRKKEGEAGASPMQFEIDLSLELSGNIDDYVPGDFYTVRLPGSAIPLNDGAYKPAYDNVLGVFNVIDAPTLEKTNYEWGNGEVYFAEYQLRSPIEFAFNEASKLRPLKILGQFQYRPTADTTIFRSDYNISGTTFAAFPIGRVGPVLMGQEISGSSAFSQEYQSIDYTPYYNDLLNGNTTPVQIYNDLVSKFGWGQSVAYWPDPSTTEPLATEDMIFQTQIMPLDRLHEQSFRVWVQSKEIEPVLKVYMYAVPEDDPTRDPILNIFTYKVEIDEVGERIRFTLHTNESDQIHPNYVHAIRSIRGEGVSTIYPDQLLPPRSTLSFTSEDLLPGRGIQLLSNGTIQFTESGTIFASHVTIDSYIDIAPGVSITVYAYEIEVDPTVSLPNGIELIAINPLAEESTRGQVERVCFSDEYKERGSYNRITLADTSEATALSPPARLFPNPARTQSTLRYELEEDAQVRISMVDVLGQERILLDAEQAAGTQELNINLQDYPAGLYYCRLMVDGEQQALPLRVQ